jgi:hypothetical protein
LVEEGHERRVVKRRARPGTLSKENPPGIARRSRQLTCVRHTEHLEEEE